MKSIVNTSLFNVSELNDLLYNCKYKFLIQNKMNRNMIETYSKDLVLFDTFEEYIINNYKNLDKNKLNKYINFLYNSFNKYPNIVFDSILFNKKNIELFFSADQINNINIYKNKITKIVNKELNNLYLNKNKEISNLLLKYSISNIGIDNRIDNVYKHILNNFQNNSSLLAYEFIIKYTAHLLSKEYNLDNIKPYITNYDIDENNIEANCIGKCFENSGVILIHKNIIKNSNSDEMLSNVIIAISHEIRHYMQARNQKCNIPSRESYYWIMFNLFSRYFSNFNYDEYNKNYNNYEIEIDANYFSFNEAHKILSKYLNNKRNDNILESERNKFETKVLSLANTKYDIFDKKLKEDIQYNIYLLDKIVKNNPILLDRHPILNYIYNKNGSRRNIYRLVNIENDYNIKGLNDLYKDYYLYDINNIFDIKLEHYDPKTVKLVINKVLDLEIEETNELIYLFNYDYNFDNKIERKRYILKVNAKTNRINNTIKYMNSNHSLIEKLDNYLINNKIDKFNILVKQLNQNIQNINNKYENDTLSRAAKVLKRMNK